MFTFTLPDVAFFEIVDERIDIKQSLLFIRVFFLTEMTRHQRRIYFYCQFSYSIVRNGSALGARLVFHTTRKLSER